MQLVRRCSSHTCYGHCVCAPHGKTCLDKDDSCTDYTLSRPFSVVNINTTHQLNEPIY